MRGWHSKYKKRELLVDVENAKSHFFVTRSHSRDISSYINVQLNVTISLGSRGSL